MKIAVDVMSGDRGLSVTVPGVIKAARLWEDTHIIMVGDQQKIVDYIEKKHHHAYVQIASKITIQHASETILMDEHPVQALRQKKNSSMHVAVNTVKNQEAEGCISAGNTGALMAISTLILRTIETIDRPAICAPMPSRRGWVYALDLGANIEITPQQLHQFALMGTAMVQAIEDVGEPKVGLMNVGAEEMKGSKITQEAHQLIGQDSLINYQGFVEGNDLYMGDVDVVVMGGLEGNIALKTSEGLAKYIAGVIKKEFTRHWLCRIVGLIGYPILKSIATNLSPSKYNGACFIGLNGIVVKSHGNAGIKGFVQAIGVTRKLILNQTPKKIKNHLC